MSSSGYTPDLGGGPQPSNLVQDKTAGIKSGATINANAGRKSITIQNQGTNVLFVKMGLGASTAATESANGTASFHYTVKAAGGNDDGTGGTLKLDTYTGIITIAGTSPRYSYAEFV